LKSAGRNKIALIGLIRFSLKSGAFCKVMLHFLLCLFNAHIDAFRLRARVVYLYIVFCLISLNISAQERINLNWPMTSDAQPLLPSEYINAGFTKGNAITVVTFDQAHGAGALGWNAYSLNPEAYFEYLIAPNEGITLTLNQVNFEISISSGAIKVAAKYSLDGFRSQKSPIGQSRLAATTTPRNLSLPADINVNYPDTLSIRIYAWGANDQQVSFYNRNVNFTLTAVIDSSLLAAQIPTQIPAPETETPTPEEIVSNQQEPLAANANSPNNDSLVEGGGILLAPMGSQTFTSSQTWTVPAGVYVITVECWGGGGGGGGTYTPGNNDGGGGGGGGGFRGGMISVSPGDMITIVVGTAGNGAGNDHTGGNGGNSSVSHTNGIITAFGGTGGGYSNNGGTGGNGGGGSFSGTISNQTSWNGGTGGTGNTNNGGGGGGGAGNAQNGGSGSVTTGGNGGNALGGNGGNGSTNDNAGGIGQVVGGAGGGASDNEASSGGNGARGQVIITWPDTPNYRAEFISMDFGSNNWCAGETRTVSVVVKNTGLATWTDVSPDVNIGLKWNTNGANWTDYYVRTNASNLLPNETRTYYLTITASNNIGAGYTTPLAIGINNLTFDVVNEGNCWFAWNSGLCGPGNSVFTSSNINIITNPTQPSAITGPTSPCVGSSQVYSVTNVAGTTYTWTFPVGWIQTAGGTTNSVTVTVGANGGTISVSPSNSCGTGPARTLAVTTSTVPAQPSAITGPTTPCVGSSQTYSITNVSGVTYNWAFPAGWVQTGGGTSNSVTVTVGAGNGNITVTPSNACGNGTARTLAVTPISAPAQPSVIAGNTTPCQGSSEIYSVTNVAGVSYAWTFPADWTQTAGGNTNSVTVTVGATSGNITVTPSNSCGAGTVRTLAVTVQALPGQPGPILPATTAVCQNSVHNFAVTPASGATSYTWAFPGATFISGQGTNVIQIRFGNLSGHLTVTLSNACGNGPAQSMAITVILSAPAMPGPITGEPAPCIGSTKTYSVTNVTGLLYSWTVPAGWVITAGQGSNSITVTVGATAGNISVVAGNACGGSAPRTLAVTPQASVPAQPSPIAGNSPVCQGSSQSYSVTAVPFVVYTWSVPAGWTITAGQGTNAITYTVGAASATITVTPSNDCGTGTAQTRNITVDIAPPAATSAIAGNNNPCETSSQTYSVTNVSGVTYTWTFPADWTITAGQGTNSVTVTTGAISGNITVIPSNGCGNGPSTTLPVSVFLLPSSAGAISGDILFCEGSTHTYSVVNVSGITYNWTVPAGWIINSGQTTNSINITAGVNSGDVQVTPHNACGDGPSSSLTVTVNPLPAAETGPDGAICVGDDIQIGDLPVTGNTYLWTANPAGEVFNTTISNPVVRPDYTTTYTLTESNPATGCSNSNEVTILANQVISISVVPIDQTICSGENAYITISSNISGTTFTYEAELFSGSGTTGFSNGTGPIIDQTITNISALPSVVDYAITARADECVNDNIRAHVTINPEPEFSNQSPVAICSDVASGLILNPSSNLVPIASYSILSINNNGLTASAGNPVTGTGFSANVIADDAWTNTTNNQVSVIYEVQGVSNLGCNGEPFLVRLAIDPEPQVTNASTKSICSGTSTNLNLIATIPSAFQWTIGTITGGITGASAGSGNTINQILTNPGNATAGTVEYLITPRSSASGCFGETFVLTVTVNPGPVVTNAPTLRICSGSNTNLTLTSTTPSSFSWTIGTITGAISGASAGSGTSINQVLNNPSNATSGTVQYLVTATSTAGSCTSAPFTITVTVDPIPSVTAWADPTSVCPGVPFDLHSSSSLIFTADVIHSENFNGTNLWTTFQNSSGGTPANADWTMRTSPYTYGTVTFNSGDNRFYLSNSAAQGGNSSARTRTYLTSPAINTSGYVSLSLDFRHYYLHDNNGHGYVRISTDGTNWTNLRDFTSTQGTSSNFTTHSVDLTTYAGSTTLYIQFYFYAERGFYWAIDNVILSGTLASTIPIISWTSNPAGFTSTNQNPTNITQGGTTTYTVSYTNPISGCSNDNSVLVTTLAAPPAAITADYCSAPGFIQLTATGGITYLWNTGETSPVILVNVAGQYSVMVTGANGCVATAFLNVSNELVVDGSFTNFNAATPSFFTEYTQHQAYWNQFPITWAPSGLHPEGLYAVNTNAWTNYPNPPDGYHPNFHGRDHTNNTVGSRNFMMLNGGTDLVGNPPHVRTIWQQTVPIVENVDYYFSAWGMNLNPASPARLQFEIVTVQNGTEQVGSIANLNVAEMPTTEGEVSLTNWVRFYSTPFWTSPAGATTAIIRIINLNTDAGGNDFGLDDISFGTLDPIPFTIAPAVSGASNTVCEGEDVELTSNITGGLAPYYFNWSGPNGFSSTLENPVILNITPASAGIYTVVVTDSYGCDPVSASLEVIVNPAPTATVTGGGNYCQFAGSPFIWFTGFDGTPPYTFEYNINGGPTETLTTWGTDISTFVFAPTDITGTFTYNLTYVSDDNGCNRAQSSSTTVIINSLPSAYITGDWVVCPHSSNLYTGNDGLTGYDWSITGNGSLSGPTNEQISLVDAGSICGESYSLLLRVTDINGCNATDEEVIMVEDTEYPLITGAIPDTDIEGCELGDLPAAVNTIGALEALGLAISDNCTTDTDLVVTFSDGTPTGTCPMVIIRTYRVTDLCGNFSTITQTFLIIDTTFPTIACKITSLQTVLINSGHVYIQSGDSWDYASSNDNCPGYTVSASLTGATNSGPHPTLDGVTFNQGLTTVTWTAADACGNEATCEFDVQVDGTADIEVVKTGPATITAGQNITWNITVTNNGPAVAPEVILTDMIPAAVIAPITYTLNGTPAGNWPGNLTFNNMAAGAGGTQVIEITGKVACDANDFSNEAMVAVSLPFIDPNPGNDESEVSTEVVNSLMVTGVVVDSECSGDGEINITVSGGTPEYSYTWIGPDGFTSSAEDLTGLASGTYTVLVTDANYCTTAETWTVSSEDTEPPTFTPPTPFGLCVESIFTANYWDPTMDIEPDRPDYYLFEAGETTLDLNTATFSDNCCTPAELEIHWRIDFYGGTPASITGTGQPSTFGLDIELPGDGTTFTDLVHTITYWLVDCNGNLSPPETVNITIRPRPDVIKQP